jgi:chemosensory pili system protein ChpC
MPLRGENLILPCAAVAEIIPYTRLQAVGEAPAWLLGTITWRNQTITLVSLEILCGLPAPLSPPERIAVMNVQARYPDLQFYAVAISGIPRLVRIDAKAITEQERRPDETPLVLSRALVKGEPALIPDLRVVEDLLRTSAVH